MKLDMNSVPLQQRHASIVTMDGANLDVYLQEQDISSVSPTQLRISSIEEIRVVYLKVMYCNKVRRQKIIKYIAYGEYVRQLIVCATSTGELAS